MNKPELKLYQVEQHYGQNATIINVVIAYSIPDVYTQMLWSELDRPTLKIKELPIARGCVLTRTIIHRGNSNH